MAKVSRKALLLICVISVLSAVFAGCAAPNSDTSADNKAYSLEGMSAKDQVHFIRANALLAVSSGAAGSDHIATSGKGVLPNGEAYNWTEYSNSDTIDFTCEYAGIISESGVAEIKSATTQMIGKEYPMDNILDAWVSVFLNLGDQHQQVNNNMDFHSAMNSLLSSIQ